MWSALRRRSKLGAIAVLAIMAAAPVAAWGRDWQKGDVFVGLSTGQYNIYDNAGILHETLNQTSVGAGNFAVNCAFDRSGVLHTTAFFFNRLERFLLPHPHSKLLPDINTVAPVPAPSGPESVSFARDGSFYVGHRVGLNSLQRYTGAGSLIRVFSPSNPATLLDLSADQRTMFFTSRSGLARTQIHRFDVVADANLPDFAALPGTDFTADLKLLPPGDGSGGLLVAQTTNIKRLDGNGNVVQQYDVTGEDSWFGIALDPDGRSFWAQTNSPGNVYRFNIASGAVDRGPLPSAANAFGICVNGTRTAALDNAPPTINITTPANGATFQQGQVVGAAYACADDANGTGIAACAGPVPPGGGIDTSTPGPKSFTVNASDVAGNTASLTRTYTVVAPTPPPPPPGRIVVSLSFDFKAFKRFTTLTRLQVKKVPRGSTVKATCAKKKKKKCPGKARKAFTKRRARGTVSLKKRFVGVRLPVGAAITVKVTKPGLIGAVKILRIRKAAAPRVSDRCLPIGKKKPQRRC
jgi:streptogramin lyase